jgi:CxxC motif-containing protein
MSGIDREIVCIVCPTGCRIRVRGANQRRLTVGGNECKRGEEYALKEISDPRRTLITTVQIDHGSLRRLPVRTNREIPKERIFPCMEVINGVRVEAPVEIGQVIIADILGTGADVVATRSMGVRRCGNPADAQSSPKVPAILQGSGRGSRPGATGPGHS